MIRQLRLVLAGRPKPAAYSPERHRQALDTAFWLVRAYYAATLLFAYSEMSSLWQLTQTGGSFEPLWPIFWASDVESTGILLLSSLIGTAMVAIALPDRRWPRVLVFLSFFFAAAFRSSFGLGSINHGNHYWIWTGFCFCFLPAGGQKTLGNSLASRYRFLLVFSFAQGLILLFYTMSGFWKAAAGIEALINGRIGSFHPEALATTAAAKMTQLDHPTLLGPWLTEHAWIGWPVYLFVIYIEFVALWLWFRPSLHRFFGLALACFHIGTFLLLGISFPKHVLILTLLFIWSPFIASKPSFLEVVASLPGIGWLFRAGMRGSFSVKRAGGDVVDVTRPGGAA